MSIDPKKLREDARRLQEARPPTTVGRETTGTTSAVRAALPVIYDLRKSGVSWPVIAQALAGQGVVQGKDRIPLTTKRLTAIVSQIESQERKRSNRRERGRRDAVQQPQDRQLRLRLSPDLIDPSSDTEPSMQSTEEDLRRSAFEKIQSLLKKE